MRSVLNIFRVVVSQIVILALILLMFKFLINFEGKITLPKIGKEVEYIYTSQFNTDEIKQYHFSVLNQDFVLGLNS